MIYIFTLDLPIFNHIHPLITQFSQHKMAHHLVAHQPAAGRWACVSVLMATFRLLLPGLTVTSAKTEQLLLVWAEVYNATEPS